MSSRNLETCHKCKYRQYPCGGPCICLVDKKKRDIIVLADEHKCPKKLFPPRLLGGWLKVVFKILGVTYLWRKYAKIKDGNICFDCFKRADQIDRTQIKVTKRFKRLFGRK